MKAIDRRKFLIGSAACAGLSGCTFGYTGPSRATADVTLQTLMGSGETRQLAAAGFVVMKDGDVIASGAVGDAAGLDPAEGAARRPFTIDTPFRVASISKMATALTALNVTERYSIGLDDNLLVAFPAPLRHPAFGDAAPITLRRLLSHTSTIQDPDAYWVAAPGNIRQLIHDGLYRMEAPDGGPLAYGPGDWFEYANINYGIAATILETATAQRFDALASQHVLYPLGMNAGFNWSGPSVQRRQTGTTLYRKVDGVWSVQVDGPETLMDTMRPAILAEPGYDVATYKPGTNGTLFSPQGGLRASLVDLAKLAAAVGRTPELTGEVWRLNADRSNGLHEDGVFRSFGTGVFQHDATASAWRGERMIGHHGEAYGLYAGAWHLPGRGIELAYAVTGTPDGAQPGGGMHPAFNVWEQSLVNIARSTVT